MSQEEIQRDRERDVLKWRVKQVIINSLGKFIDENTGQISVRSFENIPLVGNCNTVSAETSRIVSGKIEEVIKNGINPQILFGNKVIADGRTVAMHRYVVKDSKVWDPIIGIFGDMTVEEYKRDLKI